MLQDQVVHGQKSRIFGGFDGKLAVIFSYDIVLCDMDHSSPFTRDCRSHSFISGSLTMRCPHDEKSEDSVVF